MLRKHLFIIDPIEGLNLALDSSLRMAHSLQELNQETYACQIEDLYWQSGKKPSCKARLFNFDLNSKKVSINDEKSFALDSFQSILMRKDPPFDLSYIASTWFLDQNKKSLVINKPSTLRSFNEKMGTLFFPEICKATLISSNPKQLCSYILQETNNDAVLKPLHLYGGRDVLHMKDLSQNELFSRLMEITENGKTPRMVQKFDPRIYDGEIRVFLLAGKVLSGCLKVPKKGDFLANTAAGATLHSYKLSKKLKDKIERLGNKLLKWGIYFAGLDIIGDEVSEINVTSPRLLIAPGDDKDYYSLIAKWILKTSQRSSV